MKCNKIIVYGASFLAISQLIMFGYAGYYEFLGRDGTANFFLELFFLIWSPLVVSLFLYALYFLHSKLREKIFACVLCIGAWYLSGNNIYVLMPFQEDIKKYHMIHEQMREKEIEDKVAEYDKKIEQELRKHDDGFFDRESLEKIRNLDKSRVDLYKSFQRKWDGMQKEGLLLEVEKKVSKYKFVKIIVQGILSVGALYISSLYTLSSIIGISLMFLGTMVAPALSYYGGGNYAYLTNIHGTFLFWLKLVFLCIGLGVILRSTYQNGIKRC